MASYLLRNSPVPTSEKKFTFSTWFKICEADTERGIVEWYKSSTERHHIFLDTSGTLRCYSMEGGVVKINIITNALFRDFSAWYHIVIQSDNTLASSSDRYKLWVNGVAQTFSTYTWTFPQNNNINVFDGSGTRLNLGTVGEAYATWLNGYLADTYYIDGSIIAYTEFGETDATTGIWKPKTEPTIASFGNAGVHLKYENSGNIGLDSSGNGNNFSTSGTITQTVDTPSNVFCTMNPLSRPNSNANTFSNGNNTLSTTTLAFVPSFATLGMNSGKWYWEAKVYGTDMKHSIGISKPQEVLSYIGTTAGSYAFDSENARKVNNNVFTGYGVASSTNDILMIAFDADNGSIWVGKNGTWFNSATQSEIENGTTTNAMFSSITMNDYFVPAVSQDNSSIDFNFGNGYFGTTAVSSATSDESGLGIFEYTVPSGYYALCTKNINEQEYD